jgi:putative ABC transport system permease protein
MLFHYIKLAVRTLWRNKFHTFINVTGLAIGISACLVIFMIASFELSFNKGVNDYGRIYRIHSNFTGINTALNKGVPTGVGPFVKENFKGVEQVALFSNMGFSVSVPEKTGVRKVDQRSNMIITGPEYFDIISNYSWITGTPEVLLKPNQVVLTEKQARLYFGNMPASALTGRELLYMDSLTLYVAGIVRDLDIQTDFTFTDFISTATTESTWLKEYFRLNDWRGNNSSTQLFVKAQEGTSHADLIAQLPQLTKKCNEVNSSTTNNFAVQPLSNIHFNAAVGIFNTVDHIAHLPTLFTLLIVAFMLLLIGAVNFVNLETAQAIRRAREVGVRKVLGSSRGPLIVQFLSEGLLLTILAVVIAIPLAQLGMWYFPEFIPEGLTLNVYAMAPLLICITVFVGLLASSYPAFVMSSFLPAMALKNVFPGSGQPGSSLLRKVLITFQFCAAQVLIIGTLVVGWQIRYMLNKDLGFNKDAVVFFFTPWHDSHDKTIQLKNELESLALVSDLTLSQAPPSFGGWTSTTVDFDVKGEKKTITAFHKMGDPNYAKFYGIGLLAGRYTHASDTMHEFLINETMMHAMEIATPHDAVGKMIRVSNHDLPIVGVVRDFHTQSLHNAVQPVMISSEKRTHACLSLRFATHDGDRMREDLATLEKTWKKIYPNEPFYYQFLDDAMRNFYHAEYRISKLSRMATVLAIFISCLGLFGMVSLTTTQRAKEIGIRKVLGASVVQIVNLLSRNLVMLVLLSFVFATPIAAYCTTFWLEGFPYRTSQVLWVYPVTAMVTVLIALSTISHHAFKMAKRNPTESLKSE